VEEGGDVSLATRTLWAHGGYTARPSRGPWHWRHGVSLSVERGRTGGDAWWRSRTSLEAGAGYLDRSLRLTWQRTTMGGAPTQLDLLRLGGLRSSVLPRAILNGRVLMPAFAPGTAFGTDHAMQRISLGRDGRGLQAFYARHRVWTEVERSADWLALAGFEATVELPPTPLARLPGMSLTTGIAWLLHEPDRGRTRLWLGLSWHP
jgi:hypothetical protein